MRQFFTFLCSMLFISSTFAQSGQPFWSVEKATTFEQLLDHHTDELPTAYQSLRLEVDAVKAYLDQAPTEDAAKRVAPFLFDLPMPDGEMITFQIANAPVMMPGIAARYPMIQSFSGMDVNRSGYTVKLDYTPQGLHAVVIGPKGYVNIDPIDNEATPYYMSYYAKSVPTHGHIQCGVGDHIDVGDPISGTEMEKERQAYERYKSDMRGAAKVELREYRMAIATTGEYGRQNGNRVSTVMGILNTAVLKLNAIYENEAAIRFKIIDNNDKIIFLDGDTDPYITPNQGRNLLGQNNKVLSDSIGNENFDIGHVFTIACINGLAGIARLSSVCTDVKANGVTCSNYPSLDRTINAVMAHEVGHQFSAGHTFNHCLDPDPANETIPTTVPSAFEPGSGSTIMSYAGTCGTSDIADFNDPVFHVGSLVEIYQFSREGDGSTCGTLTTSDNDAPELTLPYQNGFAIPISTPFKLKANEVDDPTSNNLTYCWEQYNTGPSAAPGAFTQSGPLFRSFAPVTDPERVFPRLSIILNNGNDVAETMSDQTRGLAFRCTVRDNVVPAGGVTWEEVTFSSTASAGPFLVTSPNNGTEQWTGGSTAEVTWDVANTDNATVNCQFVNILLSTDRGNPPYTILAEKVPNDGSHSVVVPNITTNNARILVEANENIFFDVSNDEFRITASSDPGVAFEVSPFSQFVCLPSSPTIGLNFTPLNGYDELVTMSIDGLPTGVVANFSTNPFKPSEGTNLTLDVSNATFTGNVLATLSLSGTGIETFERELSLDFVSNDFTNLALLAPADGAIGVNEVPTLSWNRLPNVDEVNLEIATTPSFGGSIIVSETGIRDTFYTASQLEKNTPYYWRIRPVNPCGEGGFSLTNGFQVETSSCANYPATAELPLAIPNTGTPTVTSTINIPANGTISDLNVTNLEGSHTPVRFISAKLISPGGKSAFLFEEIICGSSALNIGLDDQAADEIPCPANDGKAHFPSEPLSIFNGENSMGEWKLEIAVTNNVSSGGEIRSWGLDICSNVSLSGPFLVNNEILDVKPGEGNPITNPLLLVEDSDNSAEELTFTLINKPLYGTLYKAGVELQVGSTFTQETIDAGNLRYVNNIDDTKTADSFGFTVEDGDNGWLKSTYTINIDASATTSTKDLFNEADVLVFPNPANQQLNVRFRKLPKGDLVVSVVDVQGRQLIRQSATQANQQLQLRTNGLTEGIYFLQLQSDEGMVIKKIAIQR